MSTSRSVRPEPPRTALPPALVMVGLLLIGANLRAGITSVGPVLDTIQDHFGLSSATASALISVPLVAFAVVSPFAPALGRRLGLEQTLGLALAVLAAGIVVRSLPGAALLWIGTALLGASVAVINVELPALVKRDFPTRIGQVTGGYSAVQSTFAALAAGLSVPLADSAPGGWRTSLGVWAALVVVALVVFAPQLRRHSHDVDEDAQDQPAVPTARSPWRTALAWQVSLFMGVQSIGYYVVITWMPTVEKSDGIGSTAAGVHQFVLNVFAIGGSLLCSRLIPRFRDQRGIGVTSSAIFAVGVAGHLVAPHGAVVWDALIGLSGGISIVLALSMFGLRTRHHGDAAALSGMAQTVGYILAAAGPIVLSSLHDATGSWRPALVVLLCLQGALAVTAMLAGRARYVS